MKKIFVIFLLIFTAFGCSKEVQDNRPTVQAYKNGDFWYSDFRAVDIDFGGFVIEGGLGNETVQLITNNDTRGTFNLGLDSDNAAIYQDADGTVYSTRNAPDKDIHISDPEGQIIVEDIDHRDPKGLYGTFWFNAYSTDGTKKVNFNRGFFYRVPLVGGLEEIQD